MNVARKANTEPPPIADRRPGQRERTLLGGVLVWELGRTRLNCKIRDLSAGGARVAVPLDVFLPNSLYLIIVREHLAHSAEVVWRNGGEIGLIFRETVDVQATMDTRVEYLRRIWDERANANALWRI
jgi:hypothetical protein